MVSEKLTKFLNGEALNEATENKQHRVTLRKFLTHTSRAETASYLAMTGWLTKKPPVLLQGAIRI
jgi:hypothetical protein